MILAAPMITYAPADTTPKSHCIQLFEYNRVVVNEQHIRWWASKLLNGMAKKQYINIVSQQREEFKNRNQRVERIADDR